MSIPSIIVMTPLLLSSFRCFPYGPRVSPQASSRRGLLFPRQLEREREREDPTTLSRQIPARIIGYERFRLAAHKFHVDRISGGSSTLVGEGARERDEEPTTSEQISSTSGNLSNLGQVGRFAQPRIERIDRESTVSTLLSKNRPPPAYPYVQKPSLLLRGKV